jgi:hypothetical protein
VVSVFMLLFALYLLIWVRPKQYLSSKPQALETRTSG